MNYNRIYLTYITHLKVKRLALLVPWTT